MMHYYEVMVLLELRFALTIHQDEMLRLGISRSTCDSAQVVSMPCMHELGSYEGCGHAFEPG